MLRSRNAAALVAAILAAAGVVTAITITLVPSSAAAAADAPPPRIERVTPPSDELVILPAVTSVAPDDGSVVVEHRIVNGTDRELPIELAIRGIDRGTGEPDPDAAVDAEVGLVADGLRLAPSEAATVASIATGVSSGVAYAVVATIPNADPPVEVASVVLVADRTSAIAIGETELTTERLRVPLGVTDGPVLIDAAVRLSNWTGHVLLERDEPGLIAWGPGDEVELGYALEGVTLPGPYRVEVVASAGAGEERATATVWLFPEVALLTAAGTLLVLTAAAVVLVLLRRRRATEKEAPSVDTPSLEDPNQEDEDG